MIPKYEDKLENRSPSRHSLPALPEEKEQNNSESYDSDEISES
jgi:hypothetical protein